MILYWLVFFAVVTVAPAFRTTKVPTRPTLRMAVSTAPNYNTFVNAESSYEAMCSLDAPGPVSLSDYMKLPVDQYVCIQMPLGATLKREDGVNFSLTIPPIKFFQIIFTPNMLCKVTQTDDSVLIASDECILSGSPGIESLNGCFKIKIRTSFRWKDLANEKSIISASTIDVEVDPPPPFKYFGKTVLEKTGTLAMKIALRNIENAFVESLARDYDRWVVDEEYRNERASCLVECDVDDEVEPLMCSDPIASGSFGGVTVCHTKMEMEAGQDGIVYRDETVNLDEAVAYAVNDDVDDDVDDETFGPSHALECPLYIDETEGEEGWRPTAREIDPMIEDDDSLAVLTDDICLMPGEPKVRIEEAPSNARRIFTGIDIYAPAEQVWRTLTAYEQLQDVVPSIVSNEVLYRTAEGGARLNQVGGAKVMPGVTFKAKTVLDVVPYEEESPIPPHMMMENLPAVTSDADIREFYRNLPLKRGVFPRPYAFTSLPHKDLTMQNVPGEGDFEHYQGVWRMQDLPNCAPEGKYASRLSYAVEIQPKGFLPVALIEGRIASDLKVNLGAIKEVVEARQTASVAISSGTTSSSSDPVSSSDSDRDSGGDSASAAGESSIGQVLELADVGLGGDERPMSPSQQINGATAAAIDQLHTESLTRDSLNEYKKRSFFDIFVSLFGWRSGEGVGWGGGEEEGQENRPEGEAIMPVDSNSVQLEGRMNRTLELLEVLQRDNQDLSDRVESLEKKIAVSGIKEIYEQQVGRK